MDDVLAGLGEVVYAKPLAVFIEIELKNLFNPTLTLERTANNINRIADTIKKVSSPHLNSCQSESQLIVTTYQ